MPRRGGEKRGNREEQQRGVRKKRQEEEGFVGSGTDSDSTQVDSGGGERPGGHNGTHL